MTTKTRARRIVLTGASGVGKTSLAFLLAETLQLNLVPETARELCREAGYDNPTEIPDQAKFRRRVLETQIEREAQHESFIADRGTIDCWVLWQRWQLCSAMTYDSEAVYQACRESANRYTHIIYIPPMFTPEPDAFRWTDPDYIKQMDRLTRLTLYDWSLLELTYQIQSNNLQERKEEVCRWLESI